MATSSITKNFVIFGKEQVEMFVHAMEKSAGFLKQNEARLSRGKIKSREQVSPMESACSRGVAHKKAEVEDDLIKKPASL